MTNEDAGRRVNARGLQPRIEVIVQIALGNGVTVNGQDVIPRADPGEMEEADRLCDCLAVLTLARDMVAKMIPEHRRASFHVVKE